jgi:hypothetical protein
LRCSLVVVCSDAKPPSQVPTAELGGIGTIVGAIGVNRKGN